MCQLCCQLDSIMATRWYGSLFVQRMRTVSQDERIGTTDRTAEKTKGKELIDSQCIIIVVMSSIVVASRWAVARACGHMRWCWSSIGGYLMQMFAGNHHHHSLLSAHNCSSAAADTRPITVVVAFQFPSDVLSSSSDFVPILTNQ
jgi:hypothetical protein